MGQFRQGNAAGGHPGSVEAILRFAASTMTSRRFPAPWRADKVPGGYVVRDANGPIAVAGPFDDAVAEYEATPPRR
jgi:hypothetical protein